MRALRFILAGLLAAGLGGCESLGDYNARNFDQFDPASPMQRMQPPFVARGGDIAPLNDNRALLVGGIVPPTAAGATVPVNDAEIYDPATDAWTVVAPMTRFRTFPATATLPDGRVLVVGDNVSSTTPVRNGAELYDPAANRWASLPAPAGANYEQPAAVALRAPGNRVLLTGSLGLVLLDVTTGVASVVPGAGFNGARGAALSMLRDGRVLCTYANRYYVFSPATNSIVQTGTLRTTRYFAGAATGDNGRVYIVGGLNSATPGFNAAPVRGMEVYDPDSARLVRTPPDLLRTGGYASLGTYQRGQCLLYLADGGGDAVADLRVGRPVEQLPFPGGGLGRASGQLADGRVIVLPNILLDLAKYPRP